MFLGVGCTGNATLSLVENHSVLSFVLMEAMWSSSTEIS